MRDGSAGAAGSGEGGGDGGDKAKARVAYQGFLALWEDADADVPVLKEGKAEYGKLQGVLAR